MSDSAQLPTASDASASTQPGANAETGKTPMMVGAIGILLVLAAAVTVVLNSGLVAGKSDSVTPTVGFVSPRDIDAAAATLTRSVARGLVNDAKHCKIPLVLITIARGTAQVGSTLRIRAGNYVSPYFSVTDGIQRIAMPYPAPYEQGAGTYIVEGDAQGAILGLAPTKVLADLPGAQNIPISWRPVSPC